MDSTTAPTAAIDPQAPIGAATSESATDTPVTPAVTDELLIEEISIDGMCGVY
ncbi:MAG: mycofactocin precursor MftA [Ilumatobacteraceae bacterium]|jgi:mycofactocin precursor